MSLPWKSKAPRVVFISGGGSGIGREFARRLAAEGASIALINRKLAPQVIEELKAAAQHDDQKFESYSADVADESALRAALERAVEELGAPDLAINSAGIQAAAALDQSTLEDFTRVVQVNLIGSRNFAALLSPHLRPGSQLVLVSSLAGLAGNFSYSAYCSSKFGVVGLAAVLRIEMKLRDVDVSVCCPGEIETPMLDEERSTMHPISKELKAFAGTLKLEPACDEMLRGIARRKYQVVPGFKARLTAFLSRYAPGIMNRVVDSMAATAAGRSARD